MDIVKILQYYAIFCLCFSPINILLLVLAYRYTDITIKINRMIDKILGIKPKEKPKTDEEKREEKEQKTDKEEETGVAVFKLPVGETYHCKHNPQQAGNSLYDIGWFTDNEFLAKIDSEGKLTTEKAGHVNVFYYRHDDSFRNGTQAYSIELIPSNEKWFAQWMIDAVIKKMDEPSMLKANIQRKIQKEIPAKGIIKYEGETNLKNIVLQYDKKRILQRGAFMFRQKESALTEEIEKELNERFERVPLKGTQSQVWIHRLEDDARNEVDAYCYIKTLSDGAFAFGIGQAWKQNSDINEFLENITMSARMFEEIFPNDETEHLEAIIERKTKKEIKPDEIIVNNFAQKQPAQSEDKETENNIESPEAEDNGEPEEPNFEQTEEDPEETPSNEEEENEEGTEEELDFKTNYDSEEDYSEGE